MLLALVAFSSQFVSNGLVDAAKDFSYQFDYSNKGVSLSDCHLACDKLTLQQQEFADAVENKLAVGLETTGLDMTNNMLDLYDDTMMPKFTFSKAVPFGAGPGARFEAASASLSVSYGDEIVMVFGGVDASGVAKNDLWEYSVHGNQYREYTTANLVDLKKGATVPAARQGAALTQVLGVGPISESAFLFGGWSTSGGYMDDAYVFVRDFWWPNKAFWTKLPSTTPAPVARRHHAMVSIGSDSYMFGGQSTEGYSGEFWKHSFDGVNDVTRGNLTTHAWTQITDLPSTLTARSGHRMILVGGDIYILGGIDNSQAAKNDFYRYNTTENPATWTNLANLPSPIAYFTAGSSTLEFRGKSIFVAGGSDGVNLNEKIYIYSIETDTWTESDIVAAPDTSAASGCSTRR